MTPSPSATKVSQGPRPAEFPRTTLSSPMSQGLGSTGEVPLSGDATHASPEDSPQRIPHIADTLSKDPGFIKDKFHIGRFITVMVNTEEKRVITEALKNNLDYASQRINIRISFTNLHYRPFPILTSLFIQEIIEHSRSKDQYIRVALKRLTGTHILEDELAEVNALNKVMFA
jgi:hypothetical protein